MGGGQREIGKLGGFVLSVARREGDAISVVEASVRGVGFFRGRLLAVAPLLGVDNSCPLLVGASIAASCQNSRGSAVRLADETAPHCSLTNFCPISRVQGTPGVCIRPPPWDGP